MPGFTRFDEQYQYSAPEHYAFWYCPTGRHKHTIQENEDPPKYCAACRADSDCDDAALDSPPIDDCNGIDVSPRRWAPMPDEQLDSVLAAISSGLRQLEADHPARLSFEHARRMLVPLGKKTKLCACGCGDLQILDDDERGR